MSATLTSTTPTACFCALASPAVGAGHVMRCLSLAAALQARGLSCRFVVTPETVATVPALSQAGHALSVIAEAAFLTPASLAAAVGPASVAVLDSYRLGRDSGLALSCQVPRVMVIDDLADRPYHGAWLLDQSYGRQPDAYAGLVPPGCRLLLGSAYALLRPQFAAERPAALARRRTLQRVERLLVSLGGTDPVHATERVLAALAEANWADRTPAVAVDVVLGRAAPGLAAVQAQAAALPGVTVHVEVQAMAALMAAADLAIGAAGTASWERCCLGLPTLALVLADNQQQVCRQLAAAGAVQEAGPLATLTPAVLAATLSGMAADVAGLRRMAERAAAVCDGRGVERVAAALLADGRMPAGPPAA